MDNENYRGRIAVDPQIHFGKPCVAGTRIPVVDVLDPVFTGTCLRIAFLMLRPLSKQPALFHLIPQNHPRDTQDLSRVGLIPACPPQCLLNQCLLDRGQIHLFLG